MLISVIITTYNWPDALEMALRSLNRQSIDHFEVIIADDGSSTDTSAMIQALRSELSFPVKHVWQEDYGFRAAEIRNKAFLKSSGDYIVFMDGDCFTLPDFLKGHQKFCENGWLTVGRRSFLRERFSKQLLSTGYRAAFSNRSLMFAKILLGGGNRPLQLLPIPVSHKARKSKFNELDKAQTCNLGVWRSDFIRVGGFDESFNEYGLEDTDLVCRLYRSGVKRISLDHLDPVLHLWHPRKKRTDKTSALIDGVLTSDRTLAIKSALQNSV